MAWHQKGFTLIELLVVIAIIAILAAILFPVFVTALDAAKTAKCVVHGQELGKASIMYMDDWNGRFPRTLTEAEIALLPKPGPYDWPGTPRAVETYWPADLSEYRLVTLRKYVKNDAIWICLSPKGYYTKRYAYGFQCSWFPRYQDSGGGSDPGFVDGDRGFCDDSTGAGRTIAEVQSLDLKGESICGPRNMPPSRKIMWQCYALGRWGNSWFDFSGSGWIPNMFPDYPHGDGSVFVYADGHAARMRVGKAWAPVRYTNLWMDQDPSVPDPH